MAVGVIALIATFAPELITEGMLYRVEPPLYRFEKNGKMSYVMSQRALYEYVKDEFTRDCEMRKNGNVMSEESILNFLRINFSYNDRLAKLADRYSCHPTMMEKIALYYNERNEKDLVNPKYWQKILKEYSHLTFEKRDGHVVIEGEVDYKGIHIPMDKHFIKMLKKFRAIQISNLYIYGYSVNKKTDLSIYEVMELFNKYMPPGIYRFKGLGEIDSEKLGELCMDPKNRIVTRIKFKNVEQDIEMIKVLLSSKAHYRALRKSLLMNIEADDIEIDT